MKVISINQIKSIRCILFSLVFIVILAGAVTELYSTTTWFIIAIVIWLLGRAIAVMLPKKDEP
ncbi:hypothetical protein F1737_02645 [Methanoplanus sp. FWC-SCC4]|uniref:Uncharacterized protein n=1 Tax=Methanochimaera problematica TaxID=2609417 RepID=A0AA97I3V9_9EURY|nr:hypothetical protein [Methanoplanus sp. FWC-SCC4]WOF15661.1 hypothetical protein F1737_02645 [Methanoplanus sp. FWC-SCC4]